MLHHKCQCFKHLGVLMTNKHLFSRPIQSLPTYQVGTCNPWLINDLRAFGIFTLVESALQIGPFCSNKPNFRKSQMDVNKVLTKNYEKWTLGQAGKTNPIQTQFKAKQTQLKPIKCQNKPNTKPNKPNSNPISKSHIHANSLWQH
jgi:hypothetical protein